MEKPKSAIEAAREYGVDIEQLRLMRQRTPTERLQYVQAMMDLVIAAQVSRHKKQQAQRERENKLRRPIAPAGSSSGEHGGD